MFSYSTNPINKSIDPEKQIDFLSLVQLIKYHPKEREIIELRALRKQKKHEDCRDFKVRNIPWLTPNALVRRRKISDPNDFHENFIQSSGYVFFDADLEDHRADELIDIKNHLIGRLRDICALISTSASARGISILFRINYPILSQAQFLKVYDFISSTYLIKVFDEIGIKLDNHVNHLGSAWFLPSDINPFVNYSNTVKLPDNFLNETSDLLYPPPIQINRLSTVSKRTNQITLQLPTIDYVLRNFRFETKVHVEGDFEIRPIEILQISWPRKIWDGTKHRHYIRIAHDFITLNPEAPVEVVVSFIHYINNQFAFPKMDYNKLVRLITGIFEKIKATTDYKNNSETRTRCIHYREGIILGGRLKSKFANRIRGLFKRREIISRIRLAKNDSEGPKKLSNSALAEKLGCSEKTISRYSRMSLVDIENDIELLKAEIQLACSKSREKQKEKGFDEVIDKNLMIANIIKNKKLALSQERFSLSGYSDQDLFYIRKFEKVLKLDYSSLIDIEGKQFYVEVSGLVKIYGWEVFVSWVFKFSSAELEKELETAQPNKLFPSLIDAVKHIRKYYQWFLNLLIKEPQLF
jgi:hypothetical protein